MCLSHCKESIWTRALCELEGKAIENEVRERNQQGAPPCWVHLPALQWGSKTFITITRPYVLCPTYLPGCLSQLKPQPQEILSHIKTRLSREHTCAPSNRHSTVWNTFSVSAGDRRQHFCNPSFLQSTFSQTLSSYRPNARTGSVRLFSPPWVGGVLFRKRKVGSANIREWLAQETGVAQGRQG